MRSLLTFVLASLSLCSLAQESPFVKFGKVSLQNLQQKTYAVDSSAKAVVLSDIGEASIEGNSKGWFSVLTSRHKVVHILSKSAYDEANVEIPLYTDGLNEERLEDLKAVTYNLDGGKISETKLERSNVFTEKRDKNWIVKKFTLPAVKEGCVIEFQYKVSSDFIQHIDPWNFQGELPCLWSEFTFSVPQFFHYTFLSHGYLKLLSDKKDHNGYFTVRESRGTGATESVSFNAGVTDFRWVAKDAPELKEESYTSTLENHVSKIEFQLASQSSPLQPHDYRGTWTGLTKDLLESDHFAGGLKGSNGWLNDEIKPVFASATSDLEKAKKIYRYVRDNFTCTDHNSIYVQQSLKEVAKTKKGKSAEINLLLTLMLRHAGLQADPVILSRSSHGYAYDLYPLITRFNYTVTQLRIGDDVLYLDASHSHLGFGKLLPDCYNGHARVVNEEATPLYLMADSLKERKVTALFLNKGSKAMWEGNMTQTAGYYESYALRQRIQEDGKEKFFKDVQREYGADVTLSETSLDSLSNYDEPLAIKYALQYNPEKANLLYLNPMFGEGYKKNPFKSAERLYPVEMPTATDETYILTMEIPEGYAVDELPKQVMVKLDQEGKSFFEYRIQVADGTISLRSRIKLTRAYYAPEEYENLREFFNLIVKKHNEQIVFKKMK